MVRPLEFGENFGDWKKKKSKLTWAHPEVDHQAPHQPDGGRDHTLSLGPASIVNSLAQVSGGWRWRKQSSSGGGGGEEHPREGVERGRGGGEEK